MTVSYTNLNPPSPGRMAYDWNSTSYVDASVDATGAPLTTNNGVIVYTNNGVNFHPTTLILSDPTNTKVEVSADDPRTILADVANSTSNATWAVVTSASIMSFPYPVSALRIGNTGSSSFEAKILV